MLNNKQKEKLLSSWGEKASSMACMAEVRVYDPLSAFECYIYALNPEDEDEILCIIKSSSVSADKWKLSELRSCYNSEGEPLQIDYEYRPRIASEILKRLIKG